MNTISPAPEEELRDPALSGLYRQHRQAEPAAALDAAILAHARQAVEKPARKSSWWKRFSAPFALAATVVLAVLVSLNVDKEQPAFVPPPIPAEQPPAPVETRQLIPAAPPLADKPQAGKADKSKAVSTIKTESTKPAARIEKKDRLEALPAPFPAAPAVMPEKAAGPPVQTKADSQLGSGAAAPASPMRDRNAASPDSRASIPEESRARTPADAQAQQKAITKESPATWIEKIRRLRREGKMAEAEQSLAEFRRAYPDYKLPEDFR
ncbi:MAG: hypothetical protein H6R18_378 [Proteobacteria bacterium]|nr:hypothetical protein [Pseudomonadota bacterium]